MNNTLRIASSCCELFHCADEVDENGWSLLKVRHNYEYFECEGSSSFNSHVRTASFTLPTICLETTSTAQIFSCLR